MVTSEQDFMVMINIRLKYRCGFSVLLFRFLSAFSLYLLVADSPPKPKIMLNPKQIQEGRRIQVTCSVFYHCPDEPVMVILSGLEEERVYRQVPTYVDRVAQTVLSFAPTWKDHRKQLTCVLKSHKGTELSQSTVELDVKHAPKGIQLNAIPGVTVQEGKKLSLKCMVNSSNPAIFRYQWYKNENLLSYERLDNDKMEFNPIREQDSGSYKCVAENEVGFANSKMLTIDVQYPPKETKVICSACNGNVKEKDQVVLQCSSKGNPPLRHYQWYKVNEPSVISNRKELRFETIQPSNSSTYFCRAYNSIGNSTSPSFKLDVKYGPKDVRLAILNHLPIKEGDNIKFNCSVGSSNPTISRYKWLKSTNYMGVPSKLPVITLSAEPGSATSYKCEACNTIACITSPAVTVDVHFAPKEVKAVQKPRGPINEGSPVKLICEVGRANPTNVTYIWYKDTHQMIQATAILTIQDATARNSGSYQCKVKNSVGISSSSPVLLDVHYGPRDIHVSLNIQEDITEGKDVSLRCENDANPSANIYSWYWNGEEIAQKTTQLLELRNIQVGQSGVYFCKVSNQVAEGESLPMILIVFYSRATMIKHTLIGLGTILALIILLGLLVHGLRRWKKNIDSAPGGTQRSSSFFVKKANAEKLCNTNHRGNEEETDGSVGFLNQAPEVSITYATVQFPPSFSDGRVVYASIKQPRLDVDPSEESVIYSVVKKPGLPTKEDTKPDYENVNKMEEEVHYSSLVNLAPKPGPTYMDSETDSESEDSIQYATLKH
ncbi:B-cell receptor CD22-like isoform X4 [Sceloporus undulatus]|uniref:B-cell receptor CD22-like isoform X4 n=1 Tax=Sceloporus undulatus TaxID=8520 RepID=UPI001C4D9DE7|nr:B-cell receptor CD22-like isoform X4 [Sceloporus undulatus]